MKLIYNTGLDIGKLFMAFCVVLIHTNAAYSNSLPFVIEWVIRQAVPYFFICSGFFLAMKTESKGLTQQEKYELCVKYGKKAFKLYILWNIIYLPVVLDFFINNGRSFYLDIISYIRAFIFVGGQQNCGHLWYIHALLVLFIIIGFGYKHGISLKFMWICFIILLVAGNLLSTIHNGESSFYLLYKTVFVTTQNALFRGGYFFTGMMLYKYRNVFTTKNIFLSLSIVVINLAVSLNIFERLSIVGALFGGISFFIIFWACGSINLSQSNQIRFHSTIIYFSHMLIVFALDQIIGLKETISMPLFYMITLVITISLSVLLQVLKQKGVGLINHLT